MWDSGDESNMSISTTTTTHDTASSGGSVVSYAMGNIAKSAGKQYFEFHTSGISDNNYGVGIGNASATFNGGGTAIGAIGSLIVASGFGTGSWPGMGGGRGAVAVDLSGTGEFWITPNVAASPINWNGSTSNDPGSNVGGISIGATILANPVFPLCTSPFSGSQVCTIFAMPAGLLIPSVPTGFNVWQTTSAANTPPEFDTDHWLSQTVPPHYVLAHTLLGGL